MSSGATWVTGTLDFNNREWAMTGDGADGASAFSNGGRV